MSHDAESSAASSPAAGARAQLRSVAKIVVLDVAGPLAAYAVLRSAGLSAVSALILSGVFPAIGVALGVVQHRRLDVIGALVLAGIVAGTVVGLVSHSARLVLMEGSVPTATFGLACLGSLLAARPLMFGFALEFVGPDSVRGREMSSLWRYREFRHLFRVITAVWGAGFLLEAAGRAVIVANASTGTALVSSKVTPILVAAVLIAWTGAYGASKRRKNQPTPAPGPEPATSPEAED
jgi:hypothetical protein